MNQQDKEQQERDKIFAVMRDLEQLHEKCQSKVRFIEKVLLGQEAVSFTIIDRCRDTIMQLNQEHYVFKTRYEEHASHEEIKARIGETYEANTALVQKAQTDLAVILSWIPLGPTSRRTDR